MAPTKSAVRARLMELAEQLRRELTAIEITIEVLGRVEGKEETSTAQSGDREPATNGKTPTNHNDENENEPIKPLGIQFAVLEAISHYCEEHSEGILRAAIYEKLCVLGYEESAIRHAIWTLKKKHKLTEGKDRHLRPVPVVVNLFEPSSNEHEQHQHPA